MVDILQLLISIIYLLALNRFFSTNIKCVKLNVY